MIQDVVGAGKHSSCSSGGKIHQNYNATEEYNKYQLIQLQQQHGLVVEVYTGRGQDGSFGTQTAGLILVVILYNFNKNEYRRI